MTAATFADVSRIDLEAEVKTLREQRYALVGALAVVSTERTAFLRQLTAVQAECTRLVNVARVLRHELQPLAERLVEARAKHPEGTDFFDMVEEVEEVRRAGNDYDDDGYLDELLDVATCAIRIRLGGDRQ